MTEGGLGRHWRTLLLILGLLAAGGLLSIPAMPVALFPQIDFPRIRVSVEAGDGPVDEVVATLTQPLELALRGVPGATAVRSTSSRGALEVSLQFPWGSDMGAALLHADAATARALAAAAASYTVQRMDPVVFPVLGLRVASPRHSLVELSQLAAEQIVPALSGIEGVAQVQLLGARQAQVQVQLEPQLLAARGLSADTVAAALGGANTVRAIGRLQDRHRLFLLLSGAQLATLDDIRDTVVAQAALGVVRVADVATVVLGEAPAWSRVSADGRPALLVDVIQQKGASTVALAAAVRERLDVLSASLPAGVVVTPYYDQSELIVASASSVLEAILGGALLAGLVLWLALRSSRLTLVVALVLPLVLLVTCLVLRALGQSFNMMTLGGLAASVGLVVDDAVVVVEHLAQRLAERAQSPAATVLDDAGHARRLLPPLAGSSAATVVVFIPLILSAGLAGSFFRPLALTMAIALTVSFLLAWQVVPLLAGKLLRASDLKQLARPDGQLLRRCKSGLRRAVERSFNRPGRVVLATLLLAGGGVLALTQLSTGFMPRMDEGGFIFDYLSPPGTSLDDTDQLAQQVEALASGMAEVQSVSRRTGVQLGGGLTEANEGDLFVRLKPQPRRRVQDVMADLRAQVQASLPGLQVETAQLMEDLIGDLIASPQPIEVQVFGPDDATRRALAVNIAKALEEIDGVVDVFDGTTIAGDAIRIQVDPVRAGFAGLDATAVSAQAEQLLAGTIATRIRTGARSVAVRMSLREQQRARFDQIGALPLRAAGGQRVRLDHVADIRIEAGQAQRDRDNLRDTVMVTARLAGRDLGSAMAQVRAQVARIALPTGYSVDYAGLYPQQQRAFADLALVLLGALALLAVVLMACYERPAVVAAILLTALLALAGALLGLWITGSELDLSALMGLTMVTGMVIELAIFYFAELDLRGAVTATAVAAAAVRRLRPILMTSSIAILALLPLACGWAAGSQLQQSLAITLVAGLLVAVPLVLLVLPGLLALLLRKRARLAC